MPRSELAGVPYWRLSGFYFFFFAILGALVPYWGPYLQAQGFSPAEIGELIAILNVSRIIAPNLWGWLSDRSGHRLAIVRLAAAVALVSFAGVLLGSSYWWLALVMVLFSFFWNATLSLFEANTLNHLGAASARYSRIRLWGSVGFIVSVIALGWVIDHRGVQALPYASLLLFVGLFVSSLFAPEHPGRDAPEVGNGAFVATLLRPEVLGFLLVCFLLQTSHGPYYAFLTIFLADHGYGAEAIGLLWAWGVVAEIGVFLVVHRLLARFSARLLMTVTLLLAALRWALVGAFPEQPLLLVLAQTLHAATFGLYHAVGILVINRYFRGALQGRGQAIYSSMTFGAGVAVGSLIAGYLWVPLGGSGTFYAAAALALLGAAVGWRTLRGLSARPAAG